MLGRESAELAGGDLAIVSAGLGWVRGATVIPSYDLTVSGGELAQRIDGDFDADVWWSSIVRGPYSSDPDEDMMGRSRVLACVSVEYVPFFASVLKRAHPDSLRIFAAPGVARNLPPALRTALLPYDERLSSISSGTRADFAQRAVRHYVTTVGLVNDLSRDREAVAAAMQALPAAVSFPRRQALDDEALLTIIRECLPTTPNRTPMLRYLRDQRGVACEQGRFARLFAEARRE